MIELQQPKAERKMGEHLVQFYEDDAVLLDEIWSFICPALAAGEAAIVIATEPRLRGLEKRIVQSGIPTDHYVALDAEATLEKISLNGLPAEKHFTEVIGNLIRAVAQDGKREVFAFGEMVALLCARDQPDAAVHLERLWNDLAHAHSFSLLCAYPMNAFSTAEHADTFRCICDSHSDVRLAESYRAPASNEELHRTIVELQQKAKALESEVARRKEIEKALQRREAELSDFLENAVEGMHRVAADGRILWANKAELALLGYTRDEYLGHHLAEFHADPEVIDDILQRLLHGETLYDFPARLRCKDGAIKHVLIHSNAFVADGEFISTRCLMRDVTDRVLLEQELNKKLQELADLDRRKDEFLAMLGHELRNPLAPILTSLELMRIQGGTTEQIARWREIIIRQVALMTRLVDDLLDVSRITRGKIELKMERLTLDYIVDHAVEIARPLIDERAHQLTLNLPAAPVYLVGDPARLSQVLANLLHNAAKYTNPGGRIALGACEEDGRLVLSVKDNGIGMEGELCKKVFDLFVQGPNSLNRARGGLGLGLTLVRRLVQMHGGTVEARSDGEGRGSEFIVTLPLHQLTLVNQCANNAQAEEVHPACSRKILIVDDNIDAAECLGEVLKASGHKVYVAHDGTNAINDAARIRPEVVILDIGMPDMNGYQVAQCLRTDVGLTTSLLVAVTGYAQERDRVSAQQAGFDHHFAKPLDINKLTAILCESR